MSLTSRLRAIARRTLPPGLQAHLRRLPAWLERRRYGHVYKANRKSPTDYLMEFDHRRWRKARASILWDNWRSATPRTLRILSGLDLVRDGDTVIDYGCGVGRVTRALAEHYRCRILAVDRSAQMLQHARRYIPNRFLQPGTVELLSDGSLLERLSSLQVGVDCILIIEVLQHIPEPVIDELLPQLLSTLKGSGRLFVFGHERLDVDAAGRISHSPIAAVLERHARIVRRDVWTDGFAAPRFSFVCSAGRREPPPPVTLARTARA